MELPSSPSVAVIRTGLFERPKIVELVRSVCQNLIPKEYRAAVAASQVRRDGHCEILIRKLDSTACVEKSVDVVKKVLSVLPSAKAMTLNSPPLVELDDSSTDFESSVCILSPPPSVNRHLPLKRVLHDASVYILDSEDEQADDSVLKAKRFCPLAVACTSSSTDEGNRNEENLVTSTSPKSDPVLSKDCQTKDKEEETVSLDEGSKNISEPCSSKGGKETNPTETSPSQDQSAGTSAESMKITVPENGGDGSGSSSSSGGSRDSSINISGSGESSTSSEDEPEIIIDSVLNVNGKMPSIDLESEEINCETDDEIIICGEQKAPTLNRSFADAVKSDFRGMSKAQRRRERTISRQADNLRITVVPAGPSGFGCPLRLADKLPDFIPLDPSGPNSRKFITKLTKKQKFEAKKQRKLNALGKATAGAPLLVDQESHNPLSKKKQKKLRKAMKKNQNGTDKDHQEEEDKKTDGPSYDGNIMNPNTEPKEQGGLRPVVIDANNVAVSHGRCGKFSFRGLQICIQYFTSRGHKVVAVVPKFRRFHVSEEERKALDAFEDEGVVCYTPSRTMSNGRKIASYDDRFIVQVAAELGGVIVSTDNYRDLLAENENWRETIEQRLLMFTWVDDILMFPNDPLGRHGPHLSQFLRFPTPSESQ